MVLALAEMAVAVVMAAVAATLVLSLLPSPTIAGQWSLEATTAQVPLDLVALVLVPLGL